MNGRVDAVMDSRTNFNAFVKKHANVTSSSGYSFSGGVLALILNDAAYTSEILRGVFVRRCPPTATR